MMEALTLQTFPFDARLRTMCLHNMHEMYPGCWVHKKADFSAGLNPPVWIGPGKIEGAEVIGPNVFSIGEFRSSDKQLHDSLIFQNFHFKANK